ncbi:DNA cytosine methyltransferase [Pseudomonadales bacterium]|nr:DNA cytosine methyltransferase [Pseudomonadales bacterium]
MSKLRVVSLFTGAMGLDIGFHQTGRFELVACVEKEQIFCDTIIANAERGFFETPPTVFCEDLSTFEPEDLMNQLGLEAGDIDLVIGGPPCQAFSTAGKRQSVQDHRGTLLWRFLAFVSALQPKFFVMENVRGLTSAALKHRSLAERPDKGGAPLSEEEEAGSVLKTFAADLSNSGGSYRVDAFEVNSVNYGAPQIRERLLVIGNRLGLKTDYPSPTHQSPSNLKKVQSELFDSNEQPVWATLRDVIGDLVDDESEVLNFSPRKLEILSLIPEGGNWRTLPVDIQQETMKRAWHAKGGRSGWWRRLTWDLPSPTIITMPNHASTSLCHPSKTRALSIKEYMRIQEFPTDWIVVGSTQKKYTQIGNAVPVRLGEVTASAILKTLDKPNEHMAGADDHSFTLNYVQAHIRTRRWFKDGEALVWDKSVQHYGAPKTRTKSRNI